MNIIKKAAFYFARKEFCRTAIIEKTDLSIIKEKNTLPVIIGLILIILSVFFVVPAFFVIGLIAVKLKKPLIGVIGIPVSYGFSWLLLILGMYLTGADYARTLGKWLARIVLEKILGKDVEKITANQMEY
ncbi:MAG: hypothetical protein CVU55_05085 [Deltaproteobacteria bacterium HGW-Deltaproteobacteria-13]|nr:MAG: hypothetical protein CVU55_05085 [Deltaproteobacteria bacterium HGW-Deltaproteobacteria-13]